MPNRTPVLSLCICAYSQLPTSRQYLLAAAHADIGLDPLLVEEGAPPFNGRLLWGTIRTPLEGIEGDEVDLRAHASKEFHEALGIRL